MEEIRNKSSVLLSIFRRKGGEGALTKIIDDNNKTEFINQIALLEGEEIPLICFKQDELNWLLISNRRISGKKEGLKLSILFTELVEVNIAMHEEFKDRITNKENFTRLALKDRSGRKYIIKCEKGEPYRGVYQVLYYIASNNKKPI
jgi:hypothetical protein